MSWNDYLFWYAQDRGGTYFGRHSEDYGGALLLEDPKGPILICTKITYSGRYGTYRDVSAAARVELERPYTLRIKKQSALRGGVNMVLGGLERGAQALGRKADLTPDYGVPELAEDRGIHTNEPEFTRWVFQSRELRALLEAWPDYKLQVDPMGPMGGWHLVEALDTLEHDPDFLGEALDRYGRPLDLAGQMASYRSSRFSEQLDALVELAKAARDAVTAWPMPMEIPKL